jgi:type IV pilus assembly protein PilA
MSRRGDEGFTLVELIMVIVIIGILAAVAVPKFINLMESSVDRSRCAASRGAINSALAMTYAVITLHDPTKQNWLETATYSDLNDTMFATGVIPVCPKGGTITIVDAHANCSIHGQ